MIVVALRYMKIDLYNNKFLSQWNLYEVARYVPSLNRVIRDKVNSLPVIISSTELDSYADKNGNIGIYTSVFAYNTKDIESAVRLGPLYFDMDSDNIDIAFNECKALYGYLSQFIPKKSILVYFTGKKGFHIECEPVALGINPSNTLPKVFRYIASDLKSKLELSTLDFSVYDLRRMWRYPNSKHQSTDLYKVLLNPHRHNNMLYADIKDIFLYASSQQSLDIESQSFDYKSNEWYRQYTYESEENEKRKDDPLAYFNQYGSKAFKNVAESQKVFDKNTLLTKCTAIQTLYDQAKTEKFLEHEARLFLCSILSYNEESIRFLHEILSYCSDYNFEKSSAHINDWVKRRQMGIGGRPYTCERANSAGVGCGSCSLEHKNKWVKIGERYIETFEKNSPSPIRFAYKSVKKEDKNG